MEQDSAFSDLVTKFQEQAVRDDPHSLTFDNLRTATNAYLAGFTNHSGVPVSISGKAGYNSFPAFSSLKEFGDGAARTARIAISRPYDVSPASDGSGKQSACFALVGPAGGGDTHIILATVRRSPETPPTQPISRAELRNALPMIFIAQRADTHNITAYGVSCIPPNPAYPGSRAGIDISHLTNEGTAAFMATEMPRLITAITPA